jgi:hypothetical protein
MNLKIISGGQTGVDQAALRAARTCGLETGGWAPHGWLTEAGPAPWLAEYGLHQHDESGSPAFLYRARTEANVMAAAGCVWFGNPHSPGGKLTLGLCGSAAYIPQYVVMDASTPKDVANWIFGYLLDGEPEDATIVALIAGNRESSNPGIGAKVETFLVEVFRLLKEMK